MTTTTRTLTRHAKARFCTGRALQILPLYGLLLAAVAWAQSADTVFEGAMTSSGRNRPAIGVTRELINICALLHQRVPIAVIAQRLNLSDELLRQKLDLLRGEGLIKTASKGRTVPTAVVVTVADAPKYFYPDERIVDDAARLLLKKLPDVKSECRKITSLGEVPFEDLSFFFGR